MNSSKLYRNIGLGLLGALLIVGVFSFNALSAKAQAAPLCEPNSSDVMYSDSNTEVDGGGSAVAVTPHSGWAAASISGATWIWDAEKIPADDTGSNPAGTVTFTRAFTITGTPTGASLDITADNSYVVTVNGNDVGSDGTWQSVESYSIPAEDLLSGANTLTIVATNDGPDEPGNPAGLLYKLVVESETCTPTTGSIEITKYACPADTVVTRASNGVGETVPDGCTLQADETFGYVHGDATDTEGPYPELDGPFIEGGATNGSGVLTINELPATGRYLVIETDGAGNKLPNDAILGLYCEGDGDTSGVNDNQELTFVAGGETALCVAYNKAAAPVENFCSVEVVSDTTNTVVENGDANAVATYTGHPSWTALIPGATWIWETLNVVDPLSDTTKTFKKTFVVEDVNTAVLSIAADNSYEVFINSVNVPIPTQTDEDNYHLENQDNNIDVASYLTENAQNIIEVRVKNWALADSTWETNPAGTLYKLIINGETIDNICKQPPQDAEACRVEVASAAGDEGVGNGDAVLAWVHDGWADELTGIADWIWDTFKVLDTSTAEIKTFTKDFYVDGPVNDATLEFAADNGYRIEINGVEVDSDPGEFNYANTQTLDVTGDVNSGWNTVEMTIQNLPIGGTPEYNPAAGIYQLIINADAKMECLPPEGDDTTITINKVTNVGGDQEFSFFLDGSEVVFTTLIGGGTSGPIEVSVGSHDLVEGAVDGWALTGVTCVDESQQTVGSQDGDPYYLSLEGGDDITCTFTNTKDQVGVSTCEIGENLLSNGSFEDPIVTGDWGIFATVANWVISSDGLELWRNFMGGASEGDQNVELDSNVSTTVTQTVTTVPGATYELRFDFSPRPNTALENNSVDALVDGVVLMNASGDGLALTDTNWMGNSQTFVAGDASTDIAFADMGVSDALGSLIDNAVLCYVSGPTNGGGETSETVLVTPSDLNITATPGVKDWYFYDDVADTASTVEVAGDYEFVIGPGNPTLGDGSVQMSVTGTERWNIATNQFAGVDLDMVSLLTFETYQPSTNPGSDQRAIYPNFDVDFDNTVVGGYQGRLVFVPSDNTTVVEDAWQSHDADSGMWRWSGYESNGNMWPDSDTDALRSWGEIMTAFPNAEVLNETFGGQFLFRAGEPYADGFTGAVDRLSIKIGTHTTTFNFEPVAPELANNNGGSTNLTSGGGGSSSRRLRSSSSSNDGEVLGASTGQVLAQTSFYPIGAPNTGFGGLRMCLY